MNSRPTREDLIGLLNKFTSGELPIEHFAIEFDELGKLGVSSTVLEPERELFSELWRFVDAYTPHYQNPTTIRSRLESLVKQFKGEPEVSAEAVKTKAMELQRVILSSP